VHPTIESSIELGESELLQGNDANTITRYFFKTVNKYLVVSRIDQQDSGHVIEFVGTVMDVTSRSVRGRLREAQRESSTRQQGTTMES